MKNRGMARAIAISASTVTSAGIGWVINLLTNNWTWSAATAFITFLALNTGALIYLDKHQPKTDTNTPTTPSTRSAIRDYIEQTGNGNITINNHDNKT